ncbi:hypothetical protein RIF29_08598 [Crotalaria pallida]|uniref:Uncharacterized protein n=1 Tax=Crotalaria pallida TaxID=3830 RepID=A0AAN9FTT6_CROPI
MQIGYFAGSSHSGSDTVESAVSEDGNGSFGSGCNSDNNNSSIGNLIEEGASSDMAEIDEDLLSRQLTYGDAGSQCRYCNVLKVCRIPRNNMYALLQPQLDVLLFEIVLPLMCFNDNDQKLWVEDPHECERKAMALLKICIVLGQTAGMDFVSEECYIVSLWIVWYGT